MVVEVGLRDGNLDDVTCLPVEKKCPLRRWATYGPHQPGSMSHTGQGERFEEVLDYFA